MVNAAEELFGCWTPDGRPDEVMPHSRAIQNIAPKDMQIFITEKGDVALDRALHSDAIVLVIGEHPLRSGDNNNVVDLGLPPGQKELVLAAS